MINKHNTTKVVYEHGPVGWVLFMAYIGSFIYFFNLEPSFGGFLLSLLKAAVWPAYVVHEVLGLLGVK